MSLINEYDPTLSLMSTVTELYIGVSKFIKSDFAFASDKALTVADMLSMLGYTFSI